MVNSWLKEWKLRADREENKKQKEKKREEGGNGGISLCLFITTFVGLMRVHFDSMMALFIQTRTGTAEKRTPRMERTCYVIQCSSQDPLELERQLQSMLVPRSWASRYSVVSVFTKVQCT